MRNRSAHERSVHFAGHVQIVSEFSPTGDQGCVLAAKRMAFAAKAEIGAAGVLRCASLPTHGCLCSFHAVSVTRRTPAYAKSAVHPSKTTPCNHSASSGPIGTSPGAC